MFIVHELREDEELLTKELICEVDGGVHDPCTVGTDGVGNVADVDGVEMLVVAGTFHKDLIVQEKRTNHRLLHGTDLK